MNCNLIAKNTLMMQMPWYHYRFIIAVVLGFFIGIMFHNKSSFGSSCIICLLVSIAVYYGIEYYAHLTVDKKKMAHLVEKCQKMSRAHHIVQAEEFDNVLSKNIRNTFNKYAGIPVQKTQEAFRNPYANINSQYEVLTSSPVPSPPAQVGTNACLLCDDSCSPVCSGANNNSCNLLISTPGPQWQPQHASSVQNRLNAGKFVPNYCPL